MILRKILRSAAGVAAVGAAVASAVVAAAFALYALLEPYLGRPGSAAIVALVMALIAAIVALILTRRPSRAHPDEDDGPLEGFVDLVRKRPLMAAAAAAALGVVAWRKPLLISSLVAAFAARPRDPRR